MYLGRIVCAGMTKDGKPCAAYRVSSRSFPNRSAKLINGKVAILPRAGFEGDLAKNPYIAYNCIRLSGAVALATNGSQTDPIIEKIAMGVPLRDAFAGSLLAMDYEKDQLNTPRVAAAVDAKNGKLMLGIIRCDALLVREYPCVPGELRFVSTYTLDHPCGDNVDDKFDAADADAICSYVIGGGRFADFENAVTAASAVWDGLTFQLAAKDA